ncbi:DUF624 domain-containing protein [Bacillus lacus]|uniref:DUF624 domain-containing protein n=1 Tax=Metabacillus lacus TaxID=1983721 RepID=A0A7X2LZR9_9BACI|nr:DUF624 domain-containing protein [Metabacillus lacus]MRX73268.1 DUF624 domain-containing protein [Metabacillus lacus]
MADKNNVFYHILHVFTSFFLLNLLWFLCCLPVVTIFPATAAMFGTARVWIKSGIDTGVVKVFFSEFRMNVKKSMILGILWTAGFLVLYMNYSIMLQSDFALSKLLLILLIFVSLLFCFITLYSFFLLVNYELSIIHIIKNSLLLALSQMNYTLLFFGMILLTIMIVYYIPFLLIVSGSLLSFSMYGLFQRLSARIEQERSKLQPNIT